MSVLLLPKEWWPIHIKVSFPLTVLKNKQNFCASLMKAKSDLLNYDLKLLRISTSLIETRIVKSLPSFMRNAYTIMKILNKVCRDEEFGPYRYFMDTYRFKNALLKYAQIHFPSLNENEYCDKTAGIATVNKETFDYTKTIDSLVDIIVQADGSSFFFSEAKIDRDDLVEEYEDEAGTLLLYRLDHMLS